VSRIILPNEPMTPIEIAGDLELVRRVNGFSQQKLADLIGMPRHWIDNVEGGHGLLRTAKLFAAFEACDARVRVIPGPMLKVLLSRQS
jgi:transcriptional regulator with XRE-family HTH domain